MNRSFMVQSVAMGMSIEMRSSSYCACILLFDEKTLPEQGFLLKINISISSCNTSGIQPDECSYSM